MLGQETSFLLPVYGARHYEKFLSTARVLHSIAGLLQLSSKNPTPVRAQRHAFVVCGVQHPQVMASSLGCTRTFLGMAVGCGRPGISYRSVDHAVGSPVSGAETVPRQCQATCSAAVRGNPPSHSIIAARSSQRSWSAQGSGVPGEAPPPKDKVPATQAALTSFSCP